MPMPTATVMQTALLITTTVAPTVTTAPGPGESPAETALQRQALHALRRERELVGEVLPVRFDEVRVRHHLAVGDAPPLLRLPQDGVLRRQGERGGGALQAAEARDAAQAE